MRTCAQAGSIRAMPETEIPRATRVDIYLFKRAEPVCRFPLRLSVFNPSIGFQSVYRFPIRPSAPYSSIGFQSVYRLPIRPSAPCSSISASAPSEVYSSSTARILDIDSSNSLSVELLKINRSSFSSGESSSEGTSKLQPAIFIKNGKN